MVDIEYEAKLTRIRALNYQIGRNKDEILARQLQLKKLRIQRQFLQEEIEAYKMNGENNGRNI